MATVRERCFEVLRAHGVTTLFGNPGSTEMAFLADFPRDFRYVLGLHEAAVMAMAIGHAQARDGAAAVNLHTFVGVGNAMGMIATAWHAQAPILVTCGQQDRRMARTHPLLWGKHVELARPYVKWSIEPHTAAEVPAAIEEGYHRALSEPRGPVLISIPMDGLDDPCPPVAAREVSYRVLPEPRAIARAAAVLDRGARVAIVVGAQADGPVASRLLVALADRLDADVFLAPGAYRHPFPEHNPRYQGELPPAQAPLAERLEPYDRVLVAGAPVFTYFPYVPGPTVAPGTKLVQLTNDPAMAARALVGASVVGDVASSLGQLLRHVKPRAPRATHTTRAKRRAHRANPRSRSGSLLPAAVFGALQAALPPRAFLAVEAPSWESFLSEDVHLDEPNSYTVTASGSLGYALPAAIGAALSTPDRPVVAILGDGSAQYTIQGLWTAARYQVPVTFVVLDNHEYAILKAFERFIGRRGAPGLDLPGIDFGGLARGYGLAYRRIARADDARATFEEAIASGAPNLVHVAVDPFVPELLRPPARS